MSKKFLRKLLAKISRNKAEIHSAEFQKFTLNFTESVLEFKEPELRELNPTYTLIRNLYFHLEVKINRMQKFKNLIKWLSVNLNFILIFRDYPLKFTAKLIKLSEDFILLSAEIKMNAFDSRQINIVKKIKVTEEIIRLMPYTRKLKKQKLFRVPISKSPLYKSYYSDEEIKKFKEDLASQNNTRKSNIELLDIYDKFNPKLFADIRQTSGTRNLLCYPSFTNADVNPEKKYVLSFNRKKKRYR